MAYSFETIIASRGYHVYKETSWSDARVGDEVKVELETDKKTLKKRHHFFIGWKMLAIFHARSLVMCTFSSNKKGEGDWDIEISKLKPSPIPSGGLEVPLSLKFKYDKKWVLDAMEEFVDRGNQSPPLMTPCYNY